MTLTSDQAQQLLTENPTASCGKDCKIPYAFSVHKESQRNNRQFTMLAGRRMGRNRSTNTSYRTQQNSIQQQYLLLTKDINIMAFVNEYVSEEDIKKYDLEKIWDSYYSSFEKGGYNRPSFRFTWTRDHERNVFFIPVHIGREEFSNQHTCVLWIKGTQITIVLNKGKESTANIKEGTGNAVWYLERISNPAGTTIDQNEIIQLLKEALIAYGYWGAWQTLPKYTVTCAF